MSREDYRFLKERIAPLFIHAAAHRESLKNLPRFTTGAGDLEMRVRWDLFHAAKNAARKAGADINSMDPSNPWDFYRRGLNDSHIDTALKAIMRELAAAPTSVAEVS